MVTFDDDEIGHLIGVPKTPVRGRANWPSLRSKRGHVEAHVEYEDAALELPTAGDPSQFGLFSGGKE